jgi:hypothetical protein
MTTTPWSVVATVASALVFAACGLPLASAAPRTTPKSSSGPCTLQHTDDDLILWERNPGTMDHSTLIGDIDLVNCKYAVDDWKLTVPRGPGYCYMIAWAHDNPGYDVTVRPSSPPTRVDNIENVPKAVRGDYINVSLLVDLTLSAIDNGELSGTGVSGMLRALQQSWGRDPATMIPDVRFTPNPHDAPNGPLVERGG